MSKRLFFHVDMDAFYASIEQLDDPRLRGRPVVVGGDGSRGVVSACSYEARSFGVHSAMPMRRAIQMCPEAVVVPVRMRRYVEISRKVMQRFVDYSPSVQAISIDEAFLDMTGTERLMGPAREIAARLKRDVLDTTQLTISVGIGSSRFIAKLASDVDKPDGLTEVPLGTEADFVLGLDLRKIWGLGKSTLRRLERLDITTVQDLRDARVEFLRGHFGESSGSYLFAVARGEDPGIYTGRGSRHSISTEQTFADDIGDPDTLHETIRDMADEVIHRSIHENWRGRTIQIKYRFPPFETHTASRTTDRPVASAEELTQRAFDMLEERRHGRSLRLLGVGISGEVEDHVVDQGELSFEEAADKPIDTTIVALRDRFGRSAIKRASRIDRSDPRE